MLQQMKLGTKLLLGFAAVAVITLVVGIVGYYGAVKGEASVKEIGGVRLPSVDSLLVIKAEAERIRGTMRTLALSGLPQEVRERQYQNLAGSRQAYDAAWNVYEPLPQTEEESRVWQRFVPAWNNWRAENNKLVQIVQQFEKLGMADPMRLGRQVESFAKDHYQLVEQVQILMNSNQTFEGGDSHTGCNFGQWLSGFTTKNPALAAEIQAMQDPHRRFHESVKTIKSLREQNNIYEMKNVFTQEMEPAMHDVFAHFEKILQIVDQGIALSEQAKVQMLGPMTETMRTAVSLLDQLVKINQEVAAHEVAAAHHQAGFVKILSVLSVVLGVLLAMGLGFLISRGINRSLTRITQGMSEGADQVASASGQVSSASQSMAEGASEQAASIEETSSSMEEMASMTKNNAENAGSADGLMKEANQVVATANDSMDRLTVSMKDISKASDETSKIIKTIDEIAFQTNLLALNAAVEAARAGEAGAGFAVVADEVRNLAMRAAEAAKNTAQLIEGTVKKVNDGSQLVTVTNEAFTKVAQSSAKVGDLIAEISAASREQSGGIDQVNIAITEMDKVVQQNAANAEESASAAEEMNAQAEQLRDYVNELVMMVTGKSGQAYTGGRKQPAGSTGTYRPQPKARVKNLPAQNTREVRPDQMIPFDDDEDFKNF
jgi:methyl-accepting chemotaxis protein